MSRARVAAGVALMGAQAASTFGVLAALLFVTPGRARAQAACEAIAASPAQPDSLAPLLRRRITFHSSSATLRETLDRIAAGAHIRLSYSPDLLPLDRRRCVSWDGVAAGEALIDILSGTSVAPIVAGTDLVVLAPRQAAPAPSAREPMEEVIPLAPMVVNAHAEDVARRPLPFASDIVDGQDLSDQSAATLSQAVNGWVPGVWAWGQSSSGMLTQYASIRGASSFGMSAPKVYIDGIEVANPLLLSQISPDAIDHIEVIRGPQGAALYGGDAISGVTNIVTRHGSLRAGAPRATIRSSFGLSSSAFAPGAALGQDHALSVRAGSAGRSGGLDLAFGSTGDFVPEAYSRHLDANGSFRLVGGRTDLSGTLRFFAQQAATPSSPLLEDALGTTAATVADAVTATSLSLRQYTAGVKATFLADSRWTHSLVLGVDGYALGGLGEPQPGVPASATDSVLRAAGAGALRGTFRFSSVAQLAATELYNSSVTLAVEHSELRQRGLGSYDADAMAGWTMGNRRPVATGPSSLYIPDGGGADDDADAAPHLASQSNSGISGQMNLAYADRLYLTGGIRIERGAMDGSVSQLAALPMLGGAWVAGDGPVSLKLRAAYGKGIRWPQALAIEGQSQGPHMPTLRTQLGPEEQAGIEAGFDLQVGRALKLQVTRFDQTATGLIQRVAMPTGVFSRVSGQGSGGHGIVYALQNVGEIGNRGWELQASAGRGPLSLAGTLSLVDSRVQKLAEGYSGDLEAGDRMLAVPARTASLTAAWKASRWSAALTASRATNWVNYDRIALARAYAGVDPGAEPVGSQLRSYWQDYAGSTHLRATFMRELRGGFSVLLSGDNLLNVQVGEPDNITVVPGRTMSLGVRAGF